jgi:hypothetical protein
MRAVIVTGLIASAAFADDPATPTAKYLPSEQQVLTLSPTLSTGIAISRPLNELEPSQPIYCF